VPLLQGGYGAGDGVNELARYPDALPRLAHTALDQIAHAKLATDFANVDRFPW